MKLSVKLIARFDVTKKRRLTFERQNNLNVDSPMKEILRI